MSKKKILVVDDEINILKTLADLLGSNGYEVVTAMDGKAGIEMARKAKPDLVLLDIMMPKVSGIELLKKVKNETKQAHIPIIVLSAKSNIETIEEAMKNYADKYMTKPYEPEDLLDSIRKALDRSLGSWVD